MDPSSNKNTGRVTLKQFEAKKPGQYMNPCEFESKNSMKCLHENDFKQELCKQFFDEYRECKKMWIEERKRNNFKRS
ncbi:Cytochrome c oxidase-assembly factor COX23, mitochondrial [Smittium mucronatum]|uniref:Cytochrome c oxidase-assembly factor COX23, mitochondrial n=1 Tax=Smittium mucronatum TaxID=133383 RepID=A0A1R0GMA8_9FUNG|nr:Cytochrome c oxidase-assembly factor COX23, mitochondrial [Smittium mucronatum]